MRGISLENKMFSSIGMKLNENVTFIQSCPTTCAFILPVPGENQSGHRRICKFYIIIAQALGIEPATLLLQAPNKRQSCSGGSANAC